MTAGRVVVDLVAPQSPSYRERGIARHGLDFAQALVEGHGDLVDRVLLHPELPPVGGLDRLIASGKVATDLEGLPPGGIFHVTSAFEPEVPARALWPRAVSRHRMRLVVTLYDLIPDIFPEMYLVDPGLRRRWRACRELVRVADHVLTLAHSGTDDVVRLLGVPEERVSAIGAGCDRRFRPAVSRPAALADARLAVDGLGERFVVYNGAIDPRKNLDRLVEAYAALPTQTRDTWQLVLVCRADPLQRNHYLVMAERLGVAGRVLLPGFVPDQTLIQLYQSTDLMVFPSLYEGYGLPVVEAQACGAPVIAADNSSLRELVAADARFDGESVPAITAAMARALTDPEHRARLLARAALPPPTWAQVADRTAEVYQELLRRDQSPGDGRSRRIPGWRQRPQVAVITPLPSTAEGPGTWGQRLTEALRGTGADVDVFADGDPSRRAGSMRVSAFVSLDHWRGGYDLVVCCVGDDPAYRGAVALLTSRLLDGSDVVVVAHQLSLRRAYEAAAATELLPDDLSVTLAHMYPGIGPEVGRSGLLPVDVAARHGILLSREAIGAAGRFLVFAEDQASRARLEARPGEAGSVQVIPPPCPPTMEERQPESATVLVVTGSEDDGEDGGFVVDELARLTGGADAITGLRVLLVGASASAAERWRREADGHGIPVPLEVVGDLTMSLSRAAVAVLTGTGAIAFGDCLAAGIPILAIDSGVPGGSGAETVPVSSDPGSLAAAIRALLVDPVRRADLGARAGDFARAHTFAAFAHDLLEPVRQDMADAAGPSDR